MKNILKKVHFPLDMSDDRVHYAVLLEEIAVETPNEDIDKVFYPGIYNFTSQRKRNLFTKVCNEEADKKIAFRFSKQKGN